MPGLTLKRFALAAASFALLCAVVAWEQPAQAGGPLIVRGTAGEPFVWSTATPVSYHTDQGTLGTLSTANADALVRQGFDPWENLATASIAFNRSGDLGLDVNGSNHMNFFNNFINDCNPVQPPAPTGAVNAIVYDTDGSVTDGILGVGENKSVLGFAGPVCIGASPNRITRGRAVLNGRFVDGLPLPLDVNIEKYKEVFVHEFGHLIGLDHSQVNVEVLAGQRDSDRLFGLPVMFPFLLGSTDARVTAGFPALAPDDEAWVSFLYQERTNNPPTQVHFDSQFGTIQGRIFFSDLQTPVQGANVIARQVDDPGTGADESRRFAVSVVSGYKFTGNPGQSATANYLPCTPASACGPSGFLGNNTAGSPFGSRDPTLIGFYEIPTRVGDYTVEVESIFEEFTEGSSVGPFGEPIPLPGPAEFWNAGESATDDPAVSTPLPVSASIALSDINIILNGTAPRFDIFESARLWWREPAPVWVRERRPAAMLVTG